MHAVPVRTGIVALSLLSSFATLLSCRTWGVVKLVPLRPSRSLHYTVSEVEWLAFHLQPPYPFEFKDPEAWPRWKRRFEQFHQAPCLDKDDGAKQVSILLYCMGKDAKETLASTNISDDDRKSYESVIGKFDVFFKVRKNVIFEHAQFNRRCRRADESAEQFITCLYSLADNCTYGTLRDEMIKDCIVVSIHDGSLLEWLQLNPDLTLEKAKTLVREREAVYEQQALLRSGPKQELAVDSVRRRPPFKNRGPNKAARKGSWSSDRSKQSSRCGKRLHPRQSCPAKEAVCHNCKKKGHYSSQCFSRVCHRSHWNRHRVW